MYSNIFIGQQPRIVGTGHVHIISSTSAAASQSGISRCGTRPGKWALSSFSRATSLCQCAISLSLPPTK